MADVSSLSPIMTGIAQGYYSPGNVGMHLFPFVDVTVSAGKTTVFPPDQFMLLNTARAAGSDYAEVQFGVDGQPYVLGNHGLIGKVPEEDIADVEGAGLDLDLQTDAVEGAMDVILLGLEYQQAMIATNPTNYSPSNKIALVGAAKWSASTGTPLSDIAAAREAIRTKCGVRPNVAVFSPVAFSACTNNPTVKAMFNPTNATVITEEMLAKAIGIKKVVVGDAIASSGGAPTDVWGNNVVLAYVPEIPLGQKAKKRQPSYGYTYRMKDHPYARNAFFDEGSGSWKQRVSMQREPYLVGKDSGYLIQNPA